MTKKMVFKFLLLGSQRKIPWHFMTFKIQSHHFYALFTMDFLFFSHVSRWEICITLSGHYNTIK
jgi:hypothetical protein